MVWQNMAGLGKVYTLGKHIGNIEDTNPRIKDAILDCDVIFAKNDELFLQFCKDLGIEYNGLVIHNDPGILYPEDESNHEKAVAYLQEGKNIGIITDVGTPVMEDAGGLIFRTARAIGIQPIIIPGLNSNFIALQHATGLGFRKFHLDARLSYNKDIRVKELNAYKDKDYMAVLYIFEEDLLDTLWDIYQVLPEIEHMYLCMDLTKSTETIFVNSAYGLWQELTAYLEDNPPKFEYENQKWFVLCF